MASSTSQEIQFVLEEGSDPTCYLKHQIQYAASPSRTTYQHVLELVQMIFPELSSECLTESQFHQEYYLCYQDDEDDRVTLSTDADVKECLRWQNVLRNGQRWVIYIARKDKRAHQMKAEEELEHQKLVTALEKVMAMILHEMHHEERYRPLQLELHQLLRSKEGKVAVEEIVLMPEYMETLGKGFHRILDTHDVKQGMVLMFQSGQMQDILDQLKHKYPPAQTLVEMLMQLLNDGTPEPKSSSSSELQSMLEMVTGCTSLTELSQNQAAEVLMNLGVSVKEMQNMTLNDRLIKIQRFYPEPSSREVQGENVRSVQASTIEQGRSSIVEEKAAPGRAVQATSGLLSCAFVSDEASEDGQTYHPKERFKKKWRVLNDGASVWPEGTCLVGVGGDDMSPRELCLNVPLALPGESVIIGIELLAPGEPSRYISFWRLCTQDGKRFGHRFWADIIVIPATDQVGKVVHSERSSLPSEEEIKQEESLVFEQAEEISPDVPMNASIEAVMLDKAETTTTASIEPSSASSPIVIQEQTWKTQLLELEMMGFSNSERNIELLDQLRGDLPQVINELLLE